MYIHNCFHIIFKIWYITIIFSYYLLCAVHLMQEMKKSLHKYFQTYIIEHQPEMVPCSALWASLCIPPPWFKLRRMRTQRGQMKGVPPWLVFWTRRASSLDFSPALAVLVSPVQNVIFLTVHFFTFLVPIAQ